jgi:F-type H+-transporting ATPase subunit b
MTMQKQTAASKLMFLVLGIVLMVGGTYLDQNIHMGWVKSLNDQGIPLEPGKTIAVIGVFLILFPVINSFFIAPLADAINSRNSELERTFTEAESLRAEMTTMRNEYEQRLASTEAAAREQIQAQIKEAQNLRTELMAEASAKADELVKKAQEEIQGEKTRVMSELRLEVVNLTLSATERILGENVDDARNRKLVEEFIQKVEVPS